MARNPVRNSVLALVLLGTGVSVADACPVCRPKMRAEVYTPDFGKTLGLLLLPLGLMAVVGVGVGRMDKPITRKEPNGR